MKSLSPCSFCDFSKRVWLLSPITQGEALFFILRERRHIAKYSSLRVLRFSGRCDRVEACMDWLVERPSSEPGISPYLVD